MRFIIVVIFLSFASAQAQEASQKYDSFRTFITDQWRPSADSQVILKEFINEQLKKLQSLAENSSFWVEEMNRYSEKGLYGEEACIRNELSAISANTAIAKSLINVLEELDGVEKVTPEIFDEFMRMGLVTESLLSLHDAITDCMIEVKIKNQSIYAHNTLIRLGTQKKLQHHKFVSTFNLRPSQYPFK